MGEPRGYSNAGGAIRVDTLHKVAIIAASGKPGNPFLLASATLANQSGLKRLPDFTPQRPVAPDGPPEAQLEGWREANHG